MRDLAPPRLYDRKVNLTTSISTEAQFEAATYRKVAWRLMPFLLLCYILAYVDRVNVGFAKLQMQSEQLYRLAPPKLKPGRTTLTFSLPHLFTELMLVCP